MNHLVGPALFAGLVDLPACKSKPTESTAPPAPSTLKPVKPKVQSNPLKNPYMGELHLHTAYSLDAYIFGNQKNDPFTAYRFAKGEEVELPAGDKKRLDAPLDFAAVTDHAEALGEYELCTNHKLPAYQSEACQGIRGGNMEFFQQVFAGLAEPTAKRVASLCGEDGKACLDAVSAPWRRVQQAANENYEPGKFTTFVAWEYSAQAPEGKGGMMHRNVIFKSDKVPDRVFSADPTRLYNPGAIAGVWAESNTREAIWDALHRKETWGTSGTRTKLRLFAGLDLPAALSTQPDWVKVGYEKGVPQGGDLKAAAAGQALRLVVWAQRDPNSAPLAKIQIIKGWLQGKELKEETVDVVCSDGATPDPKTQRCPDNGATVDLKDCSISQDRGAPELSATWTDPAFDPKSHAFYYARVLENPVCRWSVYDALKLGVPHPADLPKTVRERAWSSPVWYTP